MKLIFLLSLISLLLNSLNLITVETSNAQRKSFLIEREVIKVENDSSQWDTLNQNELCSINTAHIQSLSLNDLKTSLVTIFVEGAEVKREINTETLFPNKSSNCVLLTIFDLSPNFQRKTIRISTGNEMTSISEMQYGKFLKPQRESNLTLVQEYEKKIEKIELLKNELVSKQRVLNDLKSDLSFFQKKLSEMSEKVTVSQLSIFWEFYMNESKSLKSKITNLEDETQDLNKIQEELKNLKEDLEREKNPPSLHSDSLRILINRFSDLPTNIELNYVVSGVSWKPIYEIRGVTSSSKVNINFSALLTQSSLEYWNNSPIIFSTGSLTGFVNQPDSIRESEMSMRSSLKRGKHPEDHYEGHSEEFYEGNSYNLPPRPAPPPQSKISNGFSSVSYRLTRLVTLVSSWNPIKIPISEFEFQGSFSYVGEPKLNDKIMASVKFNNTSNAVLLEGSANIHLDTTFVGEILFPKSEVGKENTVSFGVDNTLFVEKYPETVNDEKIKEGTIFNSKTWNKRTLKDKFSLLNRKPSDIVVEMKYPVPFITKHSHDKYPAIELITPDLSNNDEHEYVRFDKQQSTIYWNVTVPSYSKIEFFVEYSIISDPSKDFFWD